LQLLNQHSIDGQPHFFHRLGDGGYVKLPNYLQ